MLPGIKSGGFLRSLLKSLRTKIIAWFFVPTAIILIAVALVNFYSYQDVTEELVIERDQSVTRLSASQLATELEDYTGLLSVIARSANLVGVDTAALRSALRRSSGGLAAFDGGVLVLDTFGTVVVTEPDQPELLGQDLSDRSYFRQIVRFPAPIFSNILTDESQGGEIIAVAVPILGDQGEFSGLVVGRFRLGATAASAFYGGIVRLRIGQSGSTYLVDESGRVIYHSDIDRIGADFSAQPVVLQVLGGQGGAIRTRNFDGEDIVAGFAPVPGTSWGLVTEESWASLTSSSQGYQRFLLLLLALGAAVPTLFVIVGLKRIMRPVEELIGAAREVARGNFSQTIAAGSGDEIGELARQFNIMADALKESYAELEQRVAERTRELNVSEERLRTVVTGAPIIMFALDREGVFTFSEGRGFDTVNVDPTRAIGRSVFEIYNDMPDILEDVRRALGGEAFASTVELYGLTLDVRYSPVRGENGEVSGVIGVATDATECAQAEQAMQEVAVLGERNRMAREIHDTLAQGFTGIVLQLEAAEQAMEESPTEVPENLIRARTLARESLQEARRSVWNLLPRALEEQPIDVALDEEVLRFATADAGKAHFSISGTRRGLPADVQTALFRICQECLTNTRKHAGATKVDVSLIYRADEVHLMVEDDGIGFDLKEMENDGRQAGFGLTGMKQRTRLLRGEFTMNSQRGRGTLVEVRIPTS